MKAWLSVLGRAAGEIAEREVRRLAILAVMWLAAALMVLVALGFATGAVYAAIEAELGPVWAALIMAGGFVVLGLFLVLAASRRGRRPDRGAGVVMPEERPGDPPANLAAVAAAFAYGFARGIGRRRRS